MVNFKVILFTIFLLWVVKSDLQAQKKVLVLTETAGFDHNTRDEVVPMIEQLGTENDFLVEHTNSSTGYFTQGKLSEYAAILFMNTTGDFLNGDEQSAFENYISSGGGAFFNHAAADAEYNWPFYHQLLGATFQGHYYGIFSNDLIIVEPTNLATNFLSGDTWTRSEEYYYYTPQNAGGNIPNPPMVDPGENNNLSHLLLIDNQTSPHDLDIVHPVSWYQYFAGGRSWYTVFGHSENTYADEEMIKHFLGGILFAMGDYNPNGPAMSVGPQSINFGMKEGDHTTVPPFEITVINATPSLGELENLSILADQIWLDISSGETSGDKTIFTCTLNEEADILTLGEHTTQIEISADSVLTQYITVKISVSPGGPNLALNKPITASSAENGNTPAANANDGDLSTRWSSQFNDGENLTVDLEAVYDVNFIKIFWEGAYADEYEILMGEDMQSLIPVHTENNGSGGNEEITLEGTGRYLRLLCQSRVTPFGSSLWEIEVYGNPTTTTLVNPLDQKSDFLVYPNLLDNNEINISVNPRIGPTYSVDIFSMSGTLIAHYVVNHQGDVQKLQLPADMRQGIYNIRVYSKRHLLYDKIIKM